MSNQVRITLKAARTNANLTLLKAAKALGIGKDTLIKWEKNSGLVNSIWQNKLSDVYQIPVDCLLFSSDGKRGGSLKSSAG